MITVSRFPRGLVVRIRRSHRRGPGSIPGVGKLYIIQGIIFLTSFYNGYENLWRLISF